MPIEEILNNVQQELGVEVALYVRANPSSNESRWTAHLAKPEGGYSYHYGHGQRPEDALIDALTQALAKAQHDLKQPKPATDPKPLVA